jgi:hypothetical protein
MEMTTRTAHEPWSRRPQFVPRQVLTAQQLNGGLEDELIRQRLLNRALHGHGVVFGYAPTVDPHGNLVTKNGCAELSCGLALDRHGRMLYWPGGWLCMGDIVGKQPDCEGHYTLCVHYAERLVPPDECGPCSKDNARWREQTVVFTLEKGCDRIDRHCPEHPEGTCISHEDYICQRIGAVSGPIPPADDLKWACADPGPLCGTDCGGWLYDPDACIPIACVEICDLTAEKKPPKDDCDPRQEYRPGQDYKEQRQTGDPKDDCRPEPEDCGCAPKYGFCPCRPETCLVRPHVYRTPLLYELLNCCDVDVARVKDVTWRRWIAAGWRWRVPWDEFERRMTSETDGFAVWFSKPIQIRTLHQGSIFMTALIQERRSDYWIPQRIPMREIRPLKREGDCAWGVLLVPETDWVQAEIAGRRSTLINGARIEFSLRGQILRDKCGQMLDARPLDIESCARCQGRPGDDFVTVFRVGPKEGCEDHDPDPPYHEEPHHPDRPDDKDPENKYPQDERPSDNTSHEME